MKHIVCLECNQPCELIEIDAGGYEEVWGAKVWHKQPIDVSSCCQVEDWEEVEEIEYAE
jgi:hypothetical protein